MWFLGMFATLLGITMVLLAVTSGHIHVDSRMRWSLTRGTVVIAIGARNGLTGLFHDLVGEGLYPSQVFELLSGTFRNLPFLVTGIDEGQVLLTIVVETKRSVGHRRLFTGSGVGTPGCKLAYKTKIMFRVVWNYKKQ